MTEAEGDCSHAEGYKTIAYGQASHAEGQSNEIYSIKHNAVAGATRIYIDWGSSGGSAPMSLANDNIINKYVAIEGNLYQVIDAGYESDEYYADYYFDINPNLQIDVYRGEGYQVYGAGAIGDLSHAEGTSTLAGGENSHAEGYNTYAMDFASHAEGIQTVAVGVNSHAEGYGTIASGEHQHAQGKFNIEDTENKYAHIVGNGTDENNLSNAHILDWDGNAWFAGDVFINSTSGIDKDEGSKKLVTEDFVLNTINNIINIPTIQSVSLLASNWDETTLQQTVQVNNVLADETKQIITPSPAIDSQNAYIETGIRCINQGTNTLTFIASELPTTDINIYITIMDAKFII